MKWFKNILGIALAVGLLVFGWKNRKKITEGASNLFKKKVNDTTTK